MGRAMRLGSHLVTIHLENAGLYGRRLAILGMFCAMFTRLGQNLCACLGSALTRK